ncbi:maleylacetoacetate isomerase [Photobacterium atrarenae]|uniref:Maleylacetoacetate isomerase n=1 Tax=Photobacterium atrarenae TaxID=865757 RepID=A0ABY5GM95_9GAMM|nr:maleylacetoacetate isomerase [Photobacterium atrarenae]UTV30377.1 maleylacetoacetate isomerase [Photobacterium atrarenae]
MELFDYFRSSASYRVRIALNLKGLDYTLSPVSLLANEQTDASYTAINPSALVPGLRTEQGMLGQSVAILEYLEERYPEPPILPRGTWEKAKCRELALTVACDIHPLNNLRVLNYLSRQLGVEQAEKTVWYHHWLKLGFQTLESLLASQEQPFCCGNQPTMADICLIPQLYNARRFELDLAPYPTLIKIEQQCQQLEAFRRAHPDAQSSSHL